MLGRRLEGLEDHATRCIPAPGQKPEIVRETAGGNGTTFDLQGHLILCEGDARRVVRIRQNKAESLAERFQGGRFNRPNDIVCRTDGSLYFTDPDKRVPYAKREIPGPKGIDNLWDGACVYRIAPDGTISIQGASEEFLTIVDSILNHLIAAKVLTGMGAAPFLATTIAAFQDDKDRLAQIKRL